jgi:hypothetical protein
VTQPVPDEARRDASPVVPVEADAATRIAFIRAERWVEYARAAVVLQELEYLYTQPPTHRMACLLLTGVSNNGKTKLLRRFCRRHPAVAHSHRERRLHPVLYALCPPVPEERRLHAAILRAIGAPFHVSESAAALYERVLLVLRATETRVLVLDEIQQLVAGPMLKHRQMLHTIKLLSNELAISVVGAGTPEAHNAIRVDAQMASRFQPMDLPLWRADGTGGQETRRLVASLERALPLRQVSRLDRPMLVAQLIARGGGTIGGMVRVVTRAAVLAVETGGERIDARLIDQATKPGIAPAVAATPRVQAMTSPEALHGSSLEWPSPQAEERPSA